MPLKCLRGGNPVFAFNVKSDEAWAHLRQENRANRQLRMPCCGSSVVLRTSKLGTRHFAHSRRGPCSTAPETAEHLLAKMTIVEGILETRWTATPEQSGQTPAGQEWRADVLATKGKNRVAFEVQWSRQEQHETDKRQQRYADAGVRGLWLFRQKDLPLGKETPSFRLEYREHSKTFDVLLPSPHYDPAWSLRSNNSSSWGQRIPLKSFVVGALNGSLRFAPAIGRRMPVEVSTARIPCWKCKRYTSVVLRISFAASRILPGCFDIPMSIYDFDKNLPGGHAALASILPANLLRQHEIGTVKPRWSKTQAREYMSNGCIHCDALQGSFFEHEYAYDATKAFETDAEFRSEWIPHLEDARPYVLRWWFDESGIDRNT